MPTTSDSNPVAQGRCANGAAACRSLRRRLMVALAAVLFAMLVNAVAGFALGAYGTLSGVAWRDFRAAERLDCVVVGSSYAQRGIDPNVLDARLGTSTVSLATPGQTLSDSFEATRAAIDEKGARRIILGLGVESLSTGDDVASRASFAMARNDGDPLGLSKAMLRLALSPSALGGRASLDLLSPWVFTPVKTPSAIADNLRARLAGEDIALSAERTTPDWRYLGRGYGNHERTLEADDSRTSVGVYGHPQARRECLRQLRRICELCRARNVQLVVVATPHPAFDLRSFGGSYVQVMGQAAEVVRDSGALFMDFNIIRPELMSLEADDYGDFEHLNFGGAEKFSTVLARELRALDEGEGVEADFESYDNWDACLERRPQV